jgi:hypothetical protein
MKKGCRRRVDGVEVKTQTNIVLGVLYVRVRVVTGRASISKKSRS